MSIMSVFWNIVTVLSRLSVSTTILGIGGNEVYLSMILGLHSVCRIDSRERSVEEHYMQPWRPLHL